jgi:hypothetical protein
MGGRVLIPLVGKTFGRLTVVSEMPNNGPKKHMWLCRCECGTEKAIDGEGLRRGRTKSCGCVTERGRASATHGLSKTNEYHIWIGMRTRCSVPTVDNYKHYGAKGIKVCERWQNSFPNFLADVGPRPSKHHTLDRKDPNGDYEPGNCRWADNITQANNRSDNRMVCYRGETLTLANALRKAGNIVGKATARSRLKKGWPMEAALETST